METSLDEKRRIRRRERGMEFAGCVPALAFVLGIMLSGGLTTPHTKTSPTDMLFAAFVLCLLIIALALVIMGPYMRETQWQKERWLRTYGQEVMASVSREPAPQALLIRSGVRNRNPHYMAYLNARDPQMGQLYAWRVNTRYFPALRNRPDGALHPVLFDPADPAFFVIPSNP